MATNDFASKFKIPCIPSVRVGLNWLSCVTEILSNLISLLWLSKYYIDSCDMRWWIANIYIIGHFGKITLGFGILLDHAGIDEDHAIMGTRNE